MERTTEVNEEISIEEVREAVRQVVEYLHEDERKHFEGCEAADRGQHIFESLERMRRWLETADAEHDAETRRRERLEAINGQPGSREALEATHGQVWDTEELQRDFAVLGYMAPYVVVCRKSDGQRGSLELQHQPRLYFNFKAD